MSEHSTPEERTEAPTAKRLEQLRNEGSLHMSHELVQVATILCGVLALSVLSSWIYEDFQTYMKMMFERVGQRQQFSRRTVFDMFSEAFTIFAPEVALLAIAVSAIAIVSVGLQTGWSRKKKIVDIKFQMINPAKGITRMFSPKNLVKTGASVLKLCVILPIAYFALKRFAPEMIMLMHMSISQVFQFTTDALFYVFWKILSVLIAFAIFDYFFTKWQWLRQNRMTKEEVKDERKSLEGDEKTKRQIQAKGLQRIVERIQNSVPQADVVITNPTHYAIALRYDRETMAAPKVVAKGKGFLALRIRKIAKEAGVPVLERRLLARALYAATEVGTEIPADMFRAVAQVLAYVYKLKNPHAAQQWSSS
ncbi:flagellar biosynthesis protein FlhB [bacterium]|nr:flagellar biosynthesis protein FlhB [bacterium]